jgi:hypothetical protein
MADGLATAFRRAGIEDVRVTVWPAEDQKAKVIRVVIGSKP